MDKSVPAVTENQPNEAANANEAGAGLSREALELEVSQVLGTFNSWWGGVKKQSATAISTIQADLAKTVKQAQTDLEHLRTTQVEVVAKSPEEREADASVFSVSRIQQSLQQAYNTAPSTNVNQLRLHLAESLRLSSAKENLDLSVKQAEKLAEEFLRKGEQWRKDAGEWVAGAVKVVPPEQESVKVGSRRGAMLAKLQQDKDGLLETPGGDYEEWLKTYTHDKEDEEAVGALRMALVPEHLTDEEFWQRYLYKKHLLTQEENRRQEIIQESQRQSQEEFNWDEPEEAEVKPKSTPKASAVTSPRDSEESYDLVSEQGRKKVDDEDSDWE